VSKSKEVNGVNRVSNKVKEVKQKMLVKGMKEFWKEKIK